MTVRNLIGPSRAEHASLEAYLRGVLTGEQLHRPLLISFSQWNFALGALADIALTLHNMGSETYVAQWSDDTPVHDVGWTTNERISRLLRSPSGAARVQQALMRGGIPRENFIRPPIARWSPYEPIVLPDHLTRSRIRAMRYRGTHIGRAILQVHPDRDTPVTDDHVWPRAWVEAAARSYAYVYDQTLEAIDRNSITALVAYNGRFLHDRAATAAAETRGIPVLNYDTGGIETDFDLTIDATHDWVALQYRMLAMYEKWPVTERDVIGSQWFEDRANHGDPTNAVFVEAQQKGAGVQLPPATCTVVYFSSSGDEIAELDLDWDAYFAGQPEALRTLAEQCRSMPGYQLVVRSHPHMRLKPKRDLADWLAAVSEAGPDLHVDPFSEVDSYALMRQADVVVTYGSTTGVEAAYAGKPVVVMGPCAYDELGCATAVSTAAELKTALEKREAGTQSGAVAYGLMMKRRGFVYQYVHRDPDDLRSLNGIEFSEARPLVLNLSQILRKRQQRKLTRIR